MTETVQVEAARIPDRDRLLEELRASGLDALPVDEVEIEVRLKGEAEEAADEVLAHAETVIVSIGAPFVPIKHEGTIYIRPPTS
jgi:ribosomal protein S11